MRKPQIDLGAEPRIGCRRRTVLDRLDDALVRARRIAEIEQGLREQQLRLDVLGLVPQRVAELDRRGGEIFGGAVRHGLVDERGRGLAVAAADERKKAYACGQRPQRARRSPL